MRQVIDLTKDKNALSYGGWKFKIMGRQKDTLIITAEQKDRLEKTEEYADFEKGCTLRHIKIEVVE